MADVTLFGVIERIKCTETSVLVTLLERRLGYKRKDGKVVDVDIVVPHAWFPRPQAQQKADEDNIPLFGWEDDGWSDDGVWRISEVELGCGKEDVGRYYCWCHAARR